MFPQAEQFKNENKMNIKTAREEKKTRYLLLKIMKKFEKVTHKYKENKHQSIIFHYKNQIKYNIIEMC